MVLFHITSQFVYSILSSAVSYPPLTIPYRFDCASRTFKKGLGRRPENRQHPLNFQGCSPWKLRWPGELIPRWLGLVNKTASSEKVGSASREFPPIFITIPYLNGKHKNSPLAKLSEVFCQAKYYIAKDGPKPAPGDSKFLRVSLAVGVGKWAVKILLLIISQCYTKHGGQKFKN